MDQSLESTVAILAFGVAAPLASLVAVVIGCGDNRLRVSAKEAAARRQKRAGASASSKRKHGGSAAASSKSKSKSRRPGGTSSSKSSKSSKSKLGAKSRQAPSKGVAVSSKSKKASGSNKSKRSKSSSSKKSSSKRSESKKSSRSKTRAVGSKVAGAAESTASRKAGSGSGALKSTGTQLSTIQQPTELREVTMEPLDLRFPATGGEKTMAVMNNSAMRLAIKVKCSDVDLYRVNPVYTFVEPGKSAKFSVYRHNGMAKADKLILVTATVSADEIDASNAFRNKHAVLPVMVLPLLSIGAPSRHYDMEPGSGRCLCAVKN